MRKRLLLSFTLVALSLYAIAQVTDTDNYRTYDGSFNNPVETSWGAAGTNLIRLLPPVYADSISAPAAPERTNPREISNTLFAQEDPINDPLNLSDFCWVFAQFLDHDIGLTPDGPEPAFIKVPVGDPHFDPFGAGTAIIPMQRNLYDPTTGTSSDNPRQHPNVLSAFIDGSGVYGSDQERADWLRSFEGGKLRVSTGNLLPFNTLDGELEGELSEEAPEMDDPVRISDKHFVAGDVRANENPLLLSFHTLFVREHNRLCDELAIKHPDWDDEMLYQYARKLVGGLIQSIVYDEWLPAMGVELPTYQGYKNDINPQLANVFTAAAFRLGHTLLNSVLQRIGNDGEVIPQGNLTLQGAFFNIFALIETGDIDPFFKGMATQIQQNMDPKLINDVRNFLFGRPGDGGLDLASININRGRERGLADFNTVRAAIGLPRYDFFQQINSNAGVFTRLLSLYQDINDIDPWVGMLAEKPMPGALFGETIMTIMKLQFAKLRDGDRFFYLVDPILSEEEKDWIKQTSLHDIIMYNTSINLMQDNVFLAIPHSEICANMTAAIEGIVTTESGNPIADAELSLSILEEDPYSYSTSAEGDYYFTDLFSCQVQKLEVRKNGGLTNGVTTVDLILIQQHILGIRDLPTPYKIIAADIDRNDQVSTLDLVFLRRAILGIDSSFPNDNTSWRFVLADHEFSNAANPFVDNFPEYLDFSTVPSGQVTASFIGVKVGDVNESAETDTQQLDGEADAALMVYATDRAVQTGESIKVPLQLGEEQKKVIAYQFSLDFEPSKLELVDIVSLNDRLKVEEHIGDFREKGMLTTSWNDEEGIGAGAGLFELIFVAKSSGKLGEWLRINSAMTPALAYDDRMRDRSVALAFRSQKEQLAEAHHLMQNEPNPFHRETAVPFYLANAADVQLRVLDLQGRIVYEEATYREAGHHKILLQADQLRAKGLLMYQLSVGAESFTKRMLLQ